MADVESTFHQIRVPVEHKDILRFLWWKDGDIESGLVVHRTTCHLFDGFRLPSWESYALRGTALDHQYDFLSGATKAVLDDLYVDDYLVSTSDEESGSGLIVQLCQLLANGGFRLTKWLSNCHELLQTIPESEIKKPLRTLDPDHGAVLLTGMSLGVHWDTS